MTREEFAVLANNKILLDGGMGSMLYAAGMPRRTSTEAWILEHPDKLREIQGAYVDAGAQIVYAPTFGVNRKTLEGYGLADKTVEMNKQLVALSKDLVGGRALVAGDMAPTGMMLECFGGDDEDEELFEVYREQAAALYEAGVDLFVIETMLSKEECLIGVDAIRSVCDLPIICTLSYQANGCTMYGTRAQDAVKALQEKGVDAVGLNCSMGPDQVADVVRMMKEVATIPVVAKPNAGLPTMDKEGHAVYSMGAHEFTGHMKKLVEAGADLVGGCCGTTPEYIRMVRMMLDGKWIG